MEAPQSDPLRLPPLKAINLIAQHTSSHEKAVRGYSHTALKFLALIGNKPPKIYCILKWDIVFFIDEIWHIRSWRTALG